MNILFVSQKYMKLYNRFYFMKCVAQCVGDLQCYVRVIYQHAGKRNNWHQTNQVNIILAGYHGFNSLWLVSINSKWNSSLFQKIFEITFLSPTTSWSYQHSSSLVAQSTSWTMAIICSLVIHNPFSLFLSRSFCCVSLFFVW